MAQWIHKGTDFTESYGTQQGREIVLDEPTGPWRLIVTHRTGVRGTLGIWGKDSSDRDAIIFNGSFNDGQEIPIDVGYNNVHVAVNLIRDDPPEAKRWCILQEWYRQALQDARVDVEIWVHK